MVSRKFVVFAMLFAVGLLLFLNSDSDCSSAESDSGDTAYVYSGSCGDDATFVFNRDSGALTISGSGGITETPWADYKESVKSIVIGDSITSLIHSAFSGCSSLVSLKLSAGLTSIDYYAFYRCSALTELTIPESVTSLGNYAFGGCSKLSSLTIPISLDLVTSKYYSAFDGVTSLRSVVFTPGTGIGVDYDYSITIDNRYWYTPWYFSKSVLTKVTMQEGITSVGACSFESCSSLTELTLPDSLTSIGHGAFYQCSSLTELSIPDSVTSIGSSAFSGCSSLISLKLGAGLTSIDDGVFSGCSALTELTIPESVTSLGIYAFRGCSKLSSLTIPISLNTVYTNDNTSPTSYYSKFAGVTSLKSVTFSQGTGIGVSLTTDTYLYTPWYLSKSVLSEVTMQEGITSVGSYMFCGCSSLTELRFPDSLIAISSSAFQDCSSLTELAIPDSVTDLGNYAFRGCSKLSSLTIPISLNTVQYNNDHYYPRYYPKFSGVTTLQSIIFTPGVGTGVDYTTSSYLNTP